MNGLRRCSKNKKTKQKEDVVYIYTMEYYPAVKNNEILPFAAARMDLEGIMLSEISQTEKDKSCMISLICGI